MRSAIFALVVAAACGGGGGKSSTMAKDTGPTCAAAADGMLSPLSEGKDQTKAMVEKKTELAALIRTRCETDHWTAEALQCFTTVKTAADVDRCGTMLTAEQQDNLVRDQSKAMGLPPPAEASAPDPATGAAPPAQAPMAVQPEAEHDRAAPAPKGKKKAAKTRKTGDPCDGGE